MLFLVRPFLKLPILWIRHLRKNKLLFSVEQWNSVFAFIAIHFAGVLHVLKRRIYELEPAKVVRSHCPSEVSWHNWCLGQHFLEFWMRTKICEDGQLIHQ